MNLKVFFLLEHFYYLHCQQKKCFGVSHFETDTENSAVY